tara:strand:- start:907 stop:1047 length:141 start_codon:yes stop_codon:yes gene_type:complete
MKWREHKTNSKNMTFQYASQAGLDLIKMLYDDAEVIKDNIKKNKNN